MYVSSNPQHKHNNIMEIFTDEQMEEFVEFMENLDIDFSLQENYSGRGMFGTESPIAFSVGSYISPIYVGAKLQEIFQRMGLADILEDHLPRFTSDSLGRSSTIYYVK